MYSEKIHILFMCLFTGIIDRFCAKIRANGLTRKSLEKYALLGVFMLLIVVFIFYKVNSHMPIETTPNKELVNVACVMMGGK